jgi:hypothetical protein
MNKISFFAFFFNQNFAGVKAYWKCPLFVVGMLLRSLGFRPPRMGLYISSEGGGKGWMGVGIQEIKRKSAWRGQRSGLQGRQVDWAMDGKRV